MENKLGAILLGLSFVVFQACSSVEGLKSSRVEETLQDTVTVRSVDVPNRLLTIINSDGNVQTLAVPEEVKNFPQIKPGDKITMRYKAAVAAEIKKPNEAVQRTESSESATTAPAGGRPGATTQRVTKTVIKVQSTDTEKNTLTFQNANGQTRTLAIKRPEMQALLKQIKPGDLVELVIDEALAIDVQPANP
jgi:uncharacterized protein (DUF2237 family)